MNEEIEYAEMLEIPVSTVNVVRKKGRRKKTKPTAEAQTAQPTPETQAAPTPSNPVVEPNPAQPSAEPLKDSVLAEVNGRVNETPAFVEGENGEGRLAFDPDPTPEHIDTVRLYSAQDAQSFDEQEQSYLFNPEMQKDGDKDEMNDTPKGVRIALGIEFAAACVLCGAIFLTNVFMPNSAINTFFRALGSPSAETTDTRTYADFTLSPVVSELCDTELTLSKEGVLSFQDECCVYPAANGKICEVTKTEDGAYVLKIQHSDSFTGVIHGLDYAYYGVGDEVKANVPVGFSKGEREVQVTMYSNGELLSCFELTDENCLAWVSAQE